MTRMTRRKALGLIVLSGVSTLVAPSRVWQEENEVERFYAFAQRELGDLLDGVTFTYTPDLEVVVYTLNGRPYKSEWRTSHIAFEKRRREEERLAARLKGTVDSAVYGLDGAYRHRTREIMVSEQGTMEPRVVAQEIWHAVSDINYDAPHEESLRRWDKLFAVALGEGALLSTYHGVKEPRAEAAAALRLIQEYNKSEESLFVTGHRCIFPPEEVAVAVSIVGREETLRERFLRAREELNRRASPVYISSQTNLSI